MASWEYLMSSLFMWCILASGVHLGAKVDVTLGAIVAFVTKLISPGPSYAPQAAGSRDGEAEALYPGGPQPAPTSTSSKHTSL